MLLLSPQVLYAQPQNLEPCLTPFGWNNNCAFFPGSPLVAATDDAAYFIEDYRKGIDFDALAIATGPTCNIPVEEFLNTGPREFVITCDDLATSTFFGSVAMPTGWNPVVGVTFESVIYIPQVVPVGNYSLDFQCGCAGNNDLISASMYSAQTSGNTNSYTIQAGDAHKIFLATTDDVVCGGTCNGGDMLFWKGSINTPITTVSPANAIRIMNIKVRYGLTGLEED